MTTHPHDDMEAFALGALDQATALRVLEHADRCPTCAVLLADALSAACALEPTGERPLSKPLNLASIPAPGIAPLHVRASWRQWSAGLVATAAVIALFIWNLDLRSNSFTVPIAALVHSHFEHHALHGAAAAGNAKIIQALDGSWLYLIADGLAPKTRYRLLETSAGRQSSVGEVVTNAAGRATGYWEQSPTKIQALAVKPESAESGQRADLIWP